MRPVSARALMPLHRCWFSSVGKIDLLQLRWLALTQLVHYSNERIPIIMNFCICCFLFVSFYKTRRIYLQSENEMCEKARFVQCFGGLLNLIIRRLQFHLRFAHKFSSFIRKRRKEFVFAFFVRSKCFVDHFCFSLHCNVHIWAIDMQLNER